MPLQLPAASQPLSGRQRAAYAFLWLIFVVLFVLGALLGVRSLAIVVEVTFAAIIALAIYQRRAVAITVLLSIAILIVVLRIVIPAPEKKPVSNPPPYTYPVLVVVKNRAYVAYWGELDETRRNYPDLSFLAPEGKKLDVEQESPLGERLFFAGYETSIEGPNRQLLEVQGGRDDDEENHSWYRVDGNTITPLYYATAAGGPHVEGFVIVVIAFFWLLLTIVVAAYVGSRHKLPG